MKSFEANTSNKRVQIGCSDLYGVLNASRCYGQEFFFFERYPPEAMTEMEMNGPFDYSKAGFTRKKRSFLVNLTTMV